MNTDTLKLKKLAAAYIASLEYDRCPDSDSAEDVMQLFEPKLSLKELEGALNDNSGRRPDEIASTMVRLINEEEPDYVLDYWIGRCKAAEKLIEEMELNYNPTIKSDELHNKWKSLK